MSCDNPTDCGTAVFPDYIAQERREQGIVLDFVLEEHPTHLTIPELRRALYAHPGDFAEMDAVERAIRDLDGAGLLSCRGGIVAPTRAAIYFNRLEMD